MGRSSEIRFYSDNSYQPLPHEAEIACRYRSRWVAKKVGMLATLIGMFFLILEIQKNEFLNPRGPWNVIGPVVFGFVAFWMSRSPIQKCPCCGGKMVLAKEKGYGLGEESLFLECRRCKKFADLKMSEGGVS